MSRVAFWRVVGWVALLGVAGWLRLGFSGAHAFAFDEARLSLIALNFARDGVFPTVGMPSSIGTPNMPAAAWLFALPYALTTNPYGATFMVGMLNVLAVAGIGWIATRHDGQAGWVGAFWLALNPFAVLYARSIWAQNLLIPLTVLWLVVYVQARRTHLPHWQGLMVFVAGFAPQVHFAGACLLIPTAYVFIRDRWWQGGKRSWGWLLGAGGAVSLCALPFMLTPHAVQDLLSASGKGQRILDAEPLRLITYMLVGGDWSFLLMGEAQLPYAPLPAWVLWAGLGSMGAVLLGLVMARGIIWLKRDLVPASPIPAPSTLNPVTPTLGWDVLAVVVLSPAVLFSWRSTPLFLHYVLPALPSAVLLVSRLVGQLGRWQGIQRGVLVVMCLIGLHWTFRLSSELTYASTHHTPNGLGTPLGILEQAANAPDPRLPIVYHTHGDNPLTQGEPSIFSVLWWGRSARIVDGRDVLILPDTPSTIGFTERAFQSWEEMNQSNLLNDAYTTPRREPIPPFEWVSYDGRTPPHGFTQLSQPHVFAHGAALWGWRWYQVGNRTRISTLWKASQPLSPNVHQFHHLYLPQQTDPAPMLGSDVSVHGASWQAGDWVIVMGDFFDLPTQNAFIIEVGHYTLTDMVRIPHQQGDRVRLGTFSLQD